MSISGNNFRNGNNNIRPMRRNSNNNNRPPEEDPGSTYQKGYTEGYFDGYKDGVLNCGSVPVSVEENGENDD